MPNRLADETSPYLLQHKDNPVDWRPWGPQALAEARARDVPLLISIGYSACHWCHVMERESFEDADVAAYMNEHFVCVKVDREERPDVDAIYMDAVQAMTGRGGWPLNAFATPDQVPFYAGTYFPPSGRQGLPGWRQVLEAIVEAWRERRAEIERQGVQIVEQLGVSARIEPAAGDPAPGLVAAAAQAIADREDHVHGGFGGAPKFPQASAIELLLARGAVAGDGERPDPAGPALRALRAMARGGIYDQLGGGFARYAVDAAWVVPHFEKMLYDNALLARAYLHGWQAGGDPLLLQVCTETLDWALRELRGPEGGFAAALDADSEGVEGKFYVWTPAQLQAALGDERLLATAVAHWGVTPAGNFEGSSILVRAGSDDDPPELPEIKRRLLAARARRVRPGRDDKRIASWNALMLAALAEAGAVLERADYLDAARACADFLLGELRTADGRLLRTWKAGRGARADIPGCLEDHAYLLEALLTLYEATFDARWFAAARTLADVTIARFADERRGGFFTTADDHEQVVARRKDLEDTPTPSGSSAMALGLLRLARLTGEAAYEQRARATIALAHPVAARHPLAFAHLLRAVDLLLAEDVREVAVVGAPADAAPLVREVRARFRPRVVLAGGDGADDGGVPLLAGRGPVGGRAAAYVCERFACQAPVTEPTALARLLD